MLKIKKTRKEKLLLKQECSGSYLLSRLLYNTLGMKFLSSEATLFFGSSQILVVALKWLSMETLELLGSWSNMEFHRVQSWVLFFTCYIQPTFQPNTPHLVTSMLMMCRRSSMVHLLISSLLLATLMLSLKICTSGCLPIGYR